MFRLFLALRYLWSRPISWVSMVGIWVSVTATIVTVAIMSGFLRESTQVIRGTTADLVLTPRSVFHGSYRSAPPPGFDVIRDAVADVEGVRDLSPHLLRPVLLRKTEPDQPDAPLEPMSEDNFAKMIGLDLELEDGATEFRQHVAAVEDPELRVDDLDRPFWLRDEHIPVRHRGEGLPVVLLGSALLETFGLKKGQLITLLTLQEDIDESGRLKPLSRRFIVGGVVKTGHYPTDSKALYVGLEDARQFTDSASDASEICLRAEPGVDLVLLRDRVLGRLAVKRLNVRVETWRDRHRHILGAVEHQRSILATVLLFFVAVACFNVFATLTIMVSDKTRDIGVLNAMGATRRDILWIFVGCGFLLTSISAGVGSVTGVLMSRYINVVHELIADVTGVRIFRDEIYHFDRIPTEVQSWFVALVVGLTILFAVLCALFPAFRAARMKPVASLRYE